MTDNTKECIEMVISVSGGLEVTKDVIIEAISMVEDSLVTFARSEDLLTLDELNDMLCELDNE